MTTLPISPGDVVYIKDVPDENGGNVKTRRCIVVAVSGEYAKVVAATSSFTEEPHYIQIPYHPNRHPKTTFSKPTAVNINWDQCVRISECEKVGTIPPMVLMQIIRRIDAINPLDSWREDPS